MLHAHAASSGAHLQEHERVLHGACRARPMQQLLQLEANRVRDELTAKIEHTQHAMPHELARGQAPKPSNLTARAGGDAPALDKLADGLGGVLPVRMPDTDRGRTSAHGGDSSQITCESYRQGQSKAGEGAPHPGGVLTFLRCRSSDALAATLTCLWQPPGTARPPRSR